MKRTLRRDIESIYHAAVERCHAGNAVRAILSRPQNRAIVVDGHTLHMPTAGVYAIGIGKAAVEMMQAVEDILGLSLVGGLVVTKRVPNGVHIRSTILEGSHPIPDDRSVEAGEAVLQFAELIPKGAIVFCLISGGGSALVEALREGVTLPELQRVTNALLRSGASIEEVNAVRSRLSRIKAGGLLDALRHTTVVNLVVSDVLGDDLSSIASGPTVPVTVRRDASEVLESYAVASELPCRSARQVTTAPLTVICANIRSALDAAADEARMLGYHPLVLASSVDGQARELGKLVGTMLRDSATGATLLQAPCCLLMGGETVVHVTGEGIGGRNTEAALAAAIALRGTAGVAVGCLATDGDDGMTGAAGAIIDGTTVPSGDQVVALESLRQNDSYTYLSERGAVFMTGPSGTNVNDLVVGLVDSLSRQAVPAPV